MSVSYFVGTDQAPAAGEFSQAPGKTISLWGEIQSYLAETCGSIDLVWKCVMKKHGWSLRAVCKKRTILYLIPQDGFFLLAFVLGDKAVARAREARLPKRVLDEINGARRYTEGTGFRLEVRTARDLPSIRKLIKIKHEN